VTNFRDNERYTKYKKYTIEMILLEFKQILKEIFVNVFHILM